MFFRHKKDISSSKTVLAFGSFDLLHAGHENFLGQARQLGNHLIVVLARDKTIRSVKGRPPVNSERKRLKNLRQTGWADEVILGNHDDKHKIILKIRPAVIALGYDQFVFTQTLQNTLIRHGLNTEITRLTPYYPQVYKSSLLRAKQENSEERQLSSSTLPAGTAAHLPNN
jgi:FAD synthetase